MPLAKAGGQRLDLLGRRFGRLIVEARSTKRKGTSVLWVCVCDCGGVKRAASYDLRFGHVRSCGCLGRERTIAVHTGNTYNVTHGMTKSPEYAAYSRAKGRCRNPNEPNYRNYGARGITFEFDDFESFYRDVGPRPSAAHSLDRINNERGYEPGNVRWATAKEQANNRRVKRALEGS